VQVRSVGEPGHIRALTRKENIRAYILQGYDTVDAEWLADAGGLYQERIP